MYRRVILTILSLAAWGALAAQQLPERSLVRRGNRQYNKGNYERSIERYTQALGADPTSFEAAYDLGNALYKAERYEAAEQTMQQAAADSLRTDEQRAAAFYNLGNAQFQQKKYKEALESYRNSLLLTPADMEAKYNYAYTKRLLKEQEQNGGGGGQDNQQDQQQQQNQNDPQQQDDPNQNKQNGEQDQQQQDPNQQPQNTPQQPSDPQKGDPGQQQNRPQNGMSQQEQEQILDAIQAREDRTQEKLKEKQGVVIRGSKNW